VSCCWLTIYYLIHVHIQTYNKSVIYICKYLLCCLYITLLLLLLTCFCIPMVYKIIHYLVCFDLYVIYICNIFIIQHIHMLRTKTCTNWMTVTYNIIYYIIRNVCNIFISVNIFFVCQTYKIVNIMVFLSREQKRLVERGKRSRNQGIKNILYFTLIC